MITVRPEGEKDDALQFDVEVEEGGAATHHHVSVSRADLARLTADGDADDLVRRSFEFLLEREPKEAILRRFDLTVIGHYFPEWEAAMRRR